MARIPPFLTEECWWFDELGDCPRSHDAANSIDRTNTHAQLAGDLWPRQAGGAQAGDLRVAPKGGFCFRSEAATPVNQKNVLRRYVHPACAEVGFRIGGWHDFRHTLTTPALKKYPTKVVSGMLGHANARTTLDTYGHVLQEDFAEPLAEMAAQLLPNVA